jgi:hypothetical protein
MNLTFLKKLGQAVAQGVATFAGIEPFIAPLIGGKADAVISRVSDVFTQASQIVAMIEVAFQGDGRGAEKLQAALRLIPTIIKSSELMAGKKIVNEQLFIAGCSDFANALVKIWNSVDPKAVDKSGDPLPIPPPSTPAQ